MRFYSFQDIRAAADCISLARDLYGATIRNGRCAATWRGGDNPEAVAIDKAQWYDHVAKAGGGAIELAAFKFDGDIQRAQEFLGAQLGLNPRMETGAAPEPDCRHARLLREGWREVARYEYRDAAGGVRHLTVRMQHPDRPGKEFVQGAPDGRGGVRWSLKGVETVLYRLPEIADSPWVLICEGEKSADRLAALGIPTTTAPMGAGKWKDSYSDSLAGKDVAIAPDNDDPGAEHAKSVARALAGKARSVKIVGPLSTRPKGGVDDWLDERPGRGAADVLQAVSDAPAWLPPESVTATAAGPSDSALAEAKQANSVPFRNYVPIEKEAEKRGRTVKEVVKEPRTHQALLDDLARRFLGFPRKVGDEMLFDHDRDSGEIVFLRDSDRLMAWIGRRSKQPPEWTRGDAMISQRQFYASIVATCRRYESISLIPSWPRRDDVYYSHADLPAPDPQHARFCEFLSMFLPASHEDRCLLAAFICAPLWFVPGIPRPAWIIDSRDGQGSGKTTLVELVANLYGHPPLSTSRSEISQHLDVVKKRCVSRTGRDARVFLVDNVTGDFHCDELASLITSSDITGMAPYGYGEETRPNDLVYCITANSATVSTDLADRSLYVFVAKPQAAEAHANSWKEAALKYVQRNRLAIVADIIHLVSNHVPFNVPTRTRFREFEQRILQPCCGDADMLASVLDHVAGSRQDSNIEEDQARAIAETFSYELGQLGIGDAPAFLRSEVVNTWGRRALNDAQGADFRGQPIQVVRNLAKAGFLPQIDRETKRIERGAKRERHSGVSWNMSDAAESVWLVTKNAAGNFETRAV